MRLDIIHFTSVYVPFRSHSPKTHQSLWIYIFKGSVKTDHHVPHVLWQAEPDTVTSCGLNVCFYHYIVRIYFKLTVTSFDLFDVRVIFFNNKIWLTCVCVCMIWLSGNFKFNCRCLCLTHLLVSSLHLYSTCFMYYVLYEKRLGEGKVIYETFMEVLQRSTLIGSFIDGLCMSSN